ncbi:hypothetical protein HanIR_Chr12g0594151 [Helianthus annuus]|nr:hypothetical protein HanIR_Chr12g0594151 [Helianthus annuus]
MVKEWDGSENLFRLRDGTKETPRDDLFGLFVPVSPPSFQICFHFYPTYKFTLFTLYEYSLIIG